MNAIIRAATSRDVPEILAIYNSAIVNTTAVYDYQPHTLEVRQAWFDDRVKKNIPVLVAEVDGHVAGFTSYGPFRAWSAYKYSVEHSVHVHLEFRNRGIAKRLLAKLIEVVRQKEVHTLIAGIDADNTISIHLHKQFGFEEIAHFREVGYKFGHWLDLKFFQLILQNDLQPNEHPL